MLQGAQPEDRNPEDTCPERRAVRNTCLRGCGQDGHQEARAGPPGHGLKLPSRGKPLLLGNLFPKGLSPE